MRSRYSRSASTRSVHSFEQGLLAGLAVSLIACPCALGLATPLAVWSAIGQAASHQVLFRSGEALERLAEVGSIRFDKTGTLTTARAVVEDFVVEHPVDRELAYSCATALAASSSHALSRAISGWNDARDSQPAVHFEHVRVVAGRGVVGDLPGTATTVSLGSPLLMEERGLVLGPTLRARLERNLALGLSVALVGWKSQTRGLFVFTEEWRRDAAAVIDWLKGEGLDVGVLTGDHAARGATIARDLGVSVLAELLPEQKLEAIRGLRRDAGLVAMVGDGVNDAPALAASDVGIALGCGADVSRDSASVCLLGNDLSRIPWSIVLARRAIRVIRQNLFWAFGYNTVGVIVAAMGWLNPAVAAFLMAASSAMVIGNSLRLRQPLPETLEPQPRNRGTEPTS